jgi:hypothetical protein
MSLHVFSNGYEWWVATDIKHAKDLCMENMGGNPDNLFDYEYLLEDVEGMGWEQLEDSRIIGMYIDEEGHLEKKTCAEWSIENGEGFLCGTEY